MSCDITGVFRCDLSTLHAAVAAFFANAAAATAGIATLSAESTRLRGMPTAVAGGLPAASAEHAASRRPGWWKKRQLHHFWRGIEPQCRSPAASDGDIETFGQSRRRKNGGAGEESGAQG